MSELIQRIRRIYNRVMPDYLTQRIRLLRAPRIVSDFEFFDRNSRFYYCRGWAFSKLSESLNITVTDPEGHNVPFCMRKELRQDISLSYYGNEDVKALCGFFIRLAPEHNVNSVIFRFDDGAGESRRTIDLKELDPLIDGQNKAAGKAFPYPYYNWYLNAFPSPSELERQRATVFPYEPLFSILVPLYNTPEGFLYGMVDSVLSQTYSKWELCLADGSPDDRLLELLETRYAGEHRIRYRKLEKNGGISENTNGALEIASGDYIALLDHDDLLTPDALYEFAKAINENPGADMLYTDEDKVLESGMPLGEGDKSYESDITGLMHFDPHFKPDFNPDLLRSYNYITHFFCASRSLINEVGNLRSEYDGAQDYDLILRCSEKARTIIHVPRILYHWRLSEQSTALNPDSKPYAYKAGERAIESHLERIGYEGTAKMDSNYMYHVSYEMYDKPFVSIIIPSKDEWPTLRTCIESLKHSTYGNFEVIIVENNSVDSETYAYYDEIDGKDNIKVVRWPDEFNFSALINFGATYARGDLLLFLNNDIEAITDNWIEKMVVHCQRPEVGIVGSKLLYPDDTIQHAGVIIGLGGFAGHAFCGLHRNQHSYFCRASVQQDLTAVTAACMLVKRSVFDEVGGLDENLPVAFNDIDFCLKAHMAGYLTVYEPGAELYHFESKTRGSDKSSINTNRFEKEARFMEERWHCLLDAGDPNYNPNLSLIRNDFSMRINSPEYPEEKTARRHREL